ncbi:MAG TPA: thiol reductant ABC exporter subunit CydD [Nocardioides sp.]|nr:thiol reductant ABC exporter subunit CydD [Nocardioides sp.]
MKPVDPRVLPHLRPARWALAGVVAGSTAGGLLLVAQAFALARLVTAAVGGEDLTGPGAWVLATFAARAATGWLTDRAAARAAGQVGTALRGRLSEAALALGGGPSRHRTGELTVLLTRGVAAVEPYLTRYLPALVVAVVLPPATLLAMAWVDWPAALTAAVTLPLIPVFAVLVGLATRDRADRQWRLLSSLSGHFVDLVRGLPTLVAYNRAALQGDRIRVVTARYRDATLATLKVAFASSAVLELVATLSVALVAVLVGLRLATGGLDLETALVVLLLAPEAYWPLRRVGAEFHAAAEGTATFEAADALLREAPVAVPRDGDAMAVEDLVVRYPDRDVPALDGVSATFPSRGLTAVTGPSGCGKSTLLAVLLGRLSPTAGTVTTPAADRIAWVPQRPWLMPASVRDNVRLGRPDATDAEVWAALEQVRLAHHVATLPGGLDTVLAEDGASFSAGERARLALARVVVSDRPWVLLDEPTAHLDEETEQVVAETLVRLAVDRAVVVVAHRPSLVALADHDVALPAPAPAPAPEHGPIATRPSAATPVSTPAIKGSPEPAASPRRRLALATLLGALAAASGVALTATAGWLIVRAADQPPVLMLILAIVGVRTFGIARPVLRYAERLVGHAAALRMLAEERARVYDDLVPLVPGRLGPHRGDLLARVVDDVDAVLDEQLRVRLPVLTSALVVAGATVFTALVSPVAVLPVLGSALVGGAAALGLSWWTARRAEAAFVRERGALSALVGSVLDGAPDLVAWQAAGRAADAVRAVAVRLARAAGRAAGGAALGRAVATLAAGVGVVAVLHVAAGTTSGPMLALLGLLPLALLDVLLPLADAGQLAVRTRAARERLAALACTEPAVTDPAEPVAAGPGRDLAVERVHAGWGEETVLRDVDLGLPAGSRVAVVGPSGSGKSTLVALLLRFLDPQRGSVALDGRRLDRLALSDVRARIGLVDDDPHVFASTLRENLRLARPGADDAELLAALDRARLTPWVAQLPEGLDTFLGDGHADVSGGERARIGVARALLGDRRVLVLDEPTAHLDSGTAEALAADVLGTSADGRSVVWVTHGRAGLDRVDRVLRLGDRATEPYVPALTAEA